MAIATKKTISECGNEMGTATKKALNLLPYLRVGDGFIFVLFIALAVGSFWVGGFVRAKDKAAGEVIAVITVGNQEITAVNLAVSADFSEVILPRPLAWAKPGLANIATLLALYTLGAASAWAVTLLRVLLGSFFIGSFMKPGFRLSLAGGCKRSHSFPIVCANYFPPF